MPSRFEPIDQRTAPTETIHVRRPLAAVETADHVHQALLSAADVEVGDAERNPPRRRDRAARPQRQGAHSP